MYSLMTSPGYLRAKRPRKDPAKTSQRPRKDDTTSRWFSSLSDVGPQPGKSSLKPALICRRAQSQARQLRSGCPEWQKAFTSLAAGTVQLSNKRIVVTLRYEKTRGVRGVVCRSRRFRYAD